MAMTMGLAAGIIGVMGMAMMFVVRMPMAVLDRLMFVFVFVVLGKMQPHTHAHEGARGEKLR